MPCLPSKYLVCGTLTSIDLSSHQNPMSTRQPGRSTTAIQQPDEPSTSDVRPEAACPTASLRRQHPLQPKPSLNDTPLDVTSSRRTAPVSTSAPDPQ
ncbi:unnamed protein product [Schistosoma mattheei]|uniref:Uncharacterized protein n=1 Tax=Schistosoma mattheei TaxID=31246 RepID=A0A183PIJ3_9TREM|nr:unnamed protein product [Schistosoma mattheei]